MRLNMNNERGWTLVELIVVMAIIGIMLGFSYIGIGFIHREKVNSTTRQLLSDIQKTRIDALTSMPTSTLIMGNGIRFSPGVGGSYTTFAWYDNDNPVNPNPDFAYQAGEEWPGSANTVQLSASVNLSYLNGDPNYPVLIYNRFGYPMLYQLNATGASMPLPSPGGLDIAITDASGSASRCIEVTENSIREGVVSGTTCTQFQ